MNPGGIADGQVVGVVSVVIGQGADAGTALKGAWSAGPKVVGVDVCDCDKGVRLAHCASVVGAAELHEAIPDGAGVSVDVRLSAGIQGHRRLEDAAVGQAAVGIARAARRDHVHVDPDGLRHTAVVTDLDGDFLEVQRSAGEDREGRPYPA